MKLSRIPFRSCLLCALLWGGGQAVLADVLYSVTDLNSFGVSFSPMSVGIGRLLNNNGQIVVAGVPSASPTSFPHAYLYSNGQMKDLIPGANNSTGTGINDAGQVVLNAATANRGSAYLYSNGQLQELGALPGGLSNDVSGINNAGQATGSSSISSSSFHAYLYSNGQMTDLGTLGGPISSGNAINNAGQVTGGADLPGYIFHAFLYSNGQMTDLGTLGGRNSSGYAINDAGQVTGFSDTASGASYGFLYSGGQMMSLGTLPGYYGSSGEAINNAGQIVGSASGYSGQHAFFYSNGLMMDLDNLVDPSLGIRFSDGLSINDKGQILASGGALDERSHVYLLDPLNSATTPVPEPGTWALFGVPFFVLLIWVHRQRRSLLSSTGQSTHEVCNSVPQ